MAPCNCGKTRSAARPRTYTGARAAEGQTQAFSLILRDGSKQHFGSRLEADAANARAGYAGVVRQNPR